MASLSIQRIEPLLLGPILILPIARCVDDMQDCNNGLILGQRVSDYIGKPPHTLLIGAGDTTGMTRSEISKGSACFADASSDLGRSIRIFSGDMRDLPPEILQRRDRPCYTPHCLDDRIPSIIASS